MSHYQYRRGGSYVGERVNPELIECLNALLEKRKNVPKQYNDNLSIIYKKALSSLKRYPLRLLSGQQAKILDGIGPVLAEQIDDWLAQHYPQLLQQSLGAGTAHQTADAQQQSQQSQESQHSQSSAAAQPASRKRPRETQSASQSQMSQDSASQYDSSDSSQQQSKPRAKRKKASDTATAASASAADSTSAPAPAPSQQSEASAQPSSRKKKDPNEPRKYVPKFKSAPWAMLVGMYRDVKRNEAPHQLTKEQVIRAADPLTDTPMVQQGVTMGEYSTYYCGWSCMHPTLVKKGLVRQVPQTKPSLYELTPEGWKFARRLYRAAKKMPVLESEVGEDDFYLTSDSEGEDDELAVAFSSQSVDTAEAPRKSATKRSRSKAAAEAEPAEASQSTDESRPKKRRKVAFDKDPIVSAFEDDVPVRAPRKPATTAETRAPQSAPVASAPTIREMYFNDYNNNPVYTMEEARIKATDAGKILYNIRINLPAEEADWLRMNEQTGFQYDRTAHCDWPEGNKLVFGWLISDLAPSQCGYDDELLAKIIPEAHSKKTATRAQTSSLVPSRPAPQVSSQTIISLDDSDSDLDEEIVESLPKEKAPPIRQKPKPPAPRPVAPVPQRLDFRDFLKNSTTSSSISATSASTASRSCPYDVILVIDNRERKRGDRSDKQYLLNHLNQWAQDIKVNQQALALGDFIWVAQNKENPEDEFVLDILLERKVIDDLAASIVDSRFHEQKFRLAQTKCSRVIYVVEGDKFEHQRRLPPQTLETAVVQTQQADKFLLYRSPNLEKTLAFIATLTRQLTEQLQQTTEKGLDVRSVHGLKDPNDGRLLTPALFNVIYGKQPTKWSDVFGRQLCLTKGVSSAIAQAIMEKYPNPKVLWQALKRSEDPKMLADLSRSGPMQGTFALRKIGPTLSKHIYELYTKPKY